MGCLCRKDGRAGEGSRVQYELSGNQQSSISVSPVIGATTDRRTGPAAAFNKDETTVSLQKVSFIFLLLTLQMLRKIIIIKRELEAKFVFHQLTTPMGKPTPIVHFTSTRGGNGESGGSYIRSFSSFLCLFAYCTDVAPPRRKSM